MEPATHIIGRQSIRLRYHGATSVPALQQMISKVCNEQLPVQLNELLDRYDDKDFALCIDKLHVSVRLADDGNLQQSLAKAIIEQIESGLQEQMAQSPAPVLTLTTDKSFVRTLRFYLEQGYLPWWSSIKDADAFQKAFAASFRQIISEVLLLLGSAHVHNRLSRLLNDQQFGALIEAAYIWPAHEWKSWQESFVLLTKNISRKQGSVDFDQLFRNAVLRSISIRPAAKEATNNLAALLAGALKQHGILPDKKAFNALPLMTIREAFTKAFKEQAEQIKPEDIKQAQKEKAQLRDEGESIFINNAGLVLVALYLPAFFRNVGLLAEDGTIRDIPRAVALLRYLVFEHEAFEEFEVVLEKLLCGLPLAAGIDVRHLVTDEEKEGADTLLQSVIEHWTALKSTSPAGLRHSFLQREGKLCFRNAQWDLTVQKQAQDILLDYLPWSISMVKLPWMPHLIIVKWNG